jgi:hypothetical protein
MPAGTRRLFAFGHTDALSSGGAGPNATPNPASGRQPPFGIVGAVGDHDF